MEAQRTYPVTEEMREKIDNAYTYHPPTPDQTERYPLIRAKAKELQLLILELTPPGDEQDIASKKLREVSMWANAAIACNE